MTGSVELSQVTGLMQTQNLTCMRATGQHCTRRSCQTHARATEVAVIVEPASNNARRLFAGVDIDAPVSIVWDSLTDYDGLGNFIPGPAPIHVTNDMDTSHTAPCIGYWTRSLGFIKGEGTLRFQDHGALCNQRMKSWLCHRMR